MDERSIKELASFFTGGPRWYDEERLILADWLADRGDGREQAVRDLKRRLIFGFQGWWLLPAVEMVNCTTPLVLSCRQGSEAPVELTVMVQPEGGVPQRVELAAAIVFETGAALYLDSAAAGSGQLLLRHVELVPATQEVLRGHPVGRSDVKSFDLGWELATWNAMLLAWDLFDELLGVQVEIPRGGVGWGTGDRFKRVRFERQEG